MDSESELERGRRGSFLYTRKLSVTGWFPPSKPLLGKPGGGRRETDWRNCMRHRNYRLRFMSSFVWCTWEQVIIVTVTVRGGAAVRATGPLPLPCCRQQGQLRGANRTLANPHPTVANIPILGGASRSFRGPSHFLVFLGEEDRCPTAHFWSQGRRRHIQVLRNKQSYRLKCNQTWELFISIIIYIAH